MDKKIFLLCALALSFFIFSQAFAVSLSGPATAKVNEDFKLEYSSNIPRQDVGSILLFRDGMNTQTSSLCTYATEVCKGVFRDRSIKPGTYSYQVKIYDKNNNLLATSNVHQVQIVEGATPTPTELKITSFTANPQSGKAPLTVTFTLSASSSKGLKGITWYFGDGNSATTDIYGNPTSYTASTSWTYKNPGTYSAYAKVKDSAGRTATSTAIQISVSSEETPTPSCTDTDGGKNYYQKGVVTAAAGSVQLPDFCKDDTILVEHYCKDNVNPGWVNYSCPQGCQDGACKGGGEEPQPQPSSGISCTPQNPKTGEQVVCQVTPKGQNPCRFYFNWGDGKEDVLSSPQAVHTYQSPGTYTLTVTIRYKWLFTCPVFNSEKTALKINVTSGETPTPTVTISNVIPSPNPFSTTTRFQVITQPENTPVDKLEIQIFDLSGKKVATLSDSNTTGITWDGGNLANGVYPYSAKVTHQGKSYGPFKDKVVIQRGAPTPTELKITSFTANPQSGKAPLTVTFTLSASSSKGLKGITWYFGDGNSATTDIYGNPTSYTASTSWTYKNPGTYSAYAKVKDSAGRTATSTAIQISVSSEETPTPSCTDTDGGKNYYQKGVVTAAAGSVQLPDFCKDDTILVEHYCKDNVNPGWVNYSCPQGCQDGACKGGGEEPQPQPSSGISCTPQNPKTGEQVVCQVTPKGQNPCRFYFNWGDGKEDVLSSPQAVHTYQSPGTYTLTVTIRYKWLFTCPVFNSEKTALKINVTSGETPTPTVTISNVIPSPNPFSTTTRFQVITQPENTPVERLRVEILDKARRQVATLSDINTTGITWDGDKLPDGTYAYMAFVGYQGKVYKFEGAVILQREGSSQEPATPPPQAPPGAWFVRLWRAITEFFQVFKF